MGGLEPAASSEHGPSTPPGQGPAFAGLPPTMPDALDGGDSATGGNGAQDDGLAALQALKELGELHAAGVLTDAEFAVKKAELLRRV